MFHISDYCVVGFKSFGNIYKSDNKGNIMNVTAEKSAEMSTIHDLLDVIVQDIRKYLLELPVGSGHRRVSSMVYARLAESQDTIYSMLMQLKRNIGGEFNSKGMAELVDLAIDQIVVVVRYYETNKDDLSPEVMEFLSDKIVAAKDIVQRLGKFEID